MASTGIKGFLPLFGFLLLLAAAATTISAVGGASRGGVIVKILENMRTFHWKDFRMGGKTGKRTNESMRSIAQQGCVSSNDYCCGNGTAKDTYKGSFCTPMCRDCRTARNVYCMASNTTGLPPSQECTVWDINYGNWGRCAQVQYPGCLVKNSSSSLSSQNLLLLVNVTGLAMALMRLDQFSP